MNSPYNSLSLVDRTLKSYAKDREEAAKANALLPPAPSSRRTDSDECFALAAHWLRRCKADHQKCIAQDSFSQSQFPARLIDVGSRGAELVHIVDTTPNSRPEERPKYLTLSTAGEPRSCSISPPSISRSSKKASRFHAYFKHFRTPSRRLESWVITSSGLTASASCKTQREISFVSQLKWPTSMARRILHLQR